VIDKANCKTFKHSVIQSGDSI